MCSHPLKCHAQDNGHANKYAHARNMHRHMHPRFCHKQRYMPRYLGTWVYASTHKLNYTFKACAHIIYPKVMSHFPCSSPSGFSLTSNELALGTA